MAKCRRAVGAFATSAPSAPFATETGLSPDGTERTSFFLATCGCVPIKMPPTRAAARLATNEAQIGAEQAGQDGQGGIACGALDTSR